MNGLHFYTSFLYLIPLYCNRGEKRQEGGKDEDITRRTCYSAGDDVAGIDDTKLLIPIAWQPG